MVGAQQSHASSIKVSIVIVACAALTTKLIHVTDPTREIQATSKAPVPSQLIR